MSLHGVTGHLNNWTVDRLPALDGKTFVVTGGNSGVGREAARILAARGARVVLACRDAEKARRAAEELSRTATGPAVDGGMAGPVGTAKISKRARDIAVANRLWEVSEELVGCAFTARA